MADLTENIIDAPAPAPAAGAERDVCLRTATAPYFVGQPGAGRRSNAVCYPTTTSTAPCRISMGQRGDILNFYQHSGEKKVILHVPADKGKSPHEWPLVWAREDKGAGAVCAWRRISGPPDGTFALQFAPTSGTEKARLAASGETLYLAVSAEGTLCTSQAPYYWMALDASMTM